MNDWIPNASLTTMIVFAVLLCGAAVGLMMRLPGSHLDPDSRDVVKSVMSLLSTMSAVLLSLLIASAKGNYDTQATELQQLSVKFVMLDRTLAMYGPEAQQARTLLKDLVIAGTDRVWAVDRAAGENAKLPPRSNSFDEFIHAVQELQPETPAQKAIQADVLQLSTGVGQLRMLMYAQSETYLSAPFLIVLTLWVACLFIGYGLYARLNGTVLMALMVGALAVAGAIFLIIELNRPYSGMLRISDKVMRNAIALMGQP